MSSPAVARVMWGDDPREALGVEIAHGNRPAPRWPMLDLATWIALVPTALALTLVTTAEGLLVARAYAEKQGVEHRPDQDLFAFGIANIASGASGSFAVGSSTSRTDVPEPRAIRVIRVG